MAKFIRQKKRTVMDIKRTMIAPRMLAFVYSLVQQWVYFCKTNHSWKNRSGALEDSISFTEPKKTKTGVQATVEAGGYSQAKYTFDFTSRVKDNTRRQNRGFVASPRSGGAMYGKANTGDRIWVDYAAYVEAKGYNVLKQGVEYIRAKGIKGVKIRKLPRG